MSAPIPERHVQTRPPEEPVGEPVGAQKGLKGKPDFEAIAAAVDANSVELGDAIGSVYGEDAKNTFLDGKALWRDHIKFFVNYTTAVAKNDKAGQTKAVNDLKGYIEAFSGFLADATGLPQDALRKGITEHVTQLKAQLDAYAAGDYEAAYDTERMAYDHMAMTGDTLAAAIADQSPDKYSMGNTTQSASDLRATLGKLMGEHALLAQFATQKGLKAEPDFAAIGAALDANAVDLSEAIGSVWGRGSEDVPRRQGDVARPHQVLRRVHDRAGEAGQAGPDEGGQRPEGLHRGLQRLPRRRDGPAAGGAPHIDHRARPCS